MNIGKWYFDNRQSCWYGDTQGQYIYKAEKKMKTEEMIAVLQAYERGETCEIFHHGRWTDFDKLMMDQSFRPNFFAYEYRIKQPEQKSLKPHEMKLMQVAPNLWAQMDGWQYPNQTQLTVRGVIE